MAEEDDQLDLGFDDAKDMLEVLEEEVVENEAIDAKTVSRESRALKFLMTNHPECKLDYVEEVLDKLPVRTYAPDHDADANHKSVPFVTQFEKTKIIGFRANQLAQGARPFVDVPKDVIDVVEIARLEFEQRRLPHILKRPMPDGTYEYWRLADLMIL